MKLKQLFKKTKFLYVNGAPRAFYVDRKFLNHLRTIPWRFIPKTKRVRGFFGKGKTRQFLHRYILTLENKYYPEVSFGNGDWFDCRLVNLKPYRPEEEGANRKRYKNGRYQKGVSFHKPSGKFTAMIRVRKKLYNLGYFDKADQAARAYAKAWNEAHPDLPPMPIASRHHGRPIIPK